MLLRNVKYTIRYLLSDLKKDYFVSKEDELAQYGKGFEILRKGPSIVSDKWAIKRWMEENCE